MLVRSCNGRERLPCACPCTIASGDGATACAGNATISSDARGTCTLPVTATAGSATSMVRSGVAKISASARCTIRTASPRSVRRVGQPASASSVVVPAIVSTPSPACPVASICSTRPSLLVAVASIMSTTSPQRGTLMRPFDNAARPSTVGSSTVPATSRSTASSAGHLLELRRQQSEEAQIGPLDTQIAPDHRVARKHVGDRRAQIRRCRRPCCAPSPRDRHGPPSASCRPAACASSVANACSSPNRMRACVVPPVSASAPRGSPMRSISEPENW